MRGGGTTHEIGVAVRDAAVRTEAVGSVSCFAWARRFGTGSGSLALDVHRSGVARGGAGAVGGRAPAHPGLNGLLLGRCTAHTVVATDTDWETRITIKKASHDLGLYHSRTWTVEWFIPSGAEPGSYRVAIAGVSYNDPLVGKATFTPYAGSSKVFSVTA